MRAPDILIVGSGMGGATLAYGLKDCGLKVQVIERGSFLPREKENASVDEVFHKKRYRSVDVWTDGGGRRFNPGIHYYVGGNTKVYGAAMMRLRARDFEAVDHADGVSPAWPLRYAEIEPSYARAEAMMGVRGETGTDPTEPPHSRPYPHLAIPHDPPIARLVASLKREGLNPFPLPVSIQQGDGGGCIRCCTCDGFPCPFDAKGDAENRCLRPALLGGNVTLETGVKALRLIASPDGRRVDGVEVETRRQREIRRAPIVVLAAGAIHSAALLLRSAGGIHRAGLANGSGLVGRNYMAHNPTAVMAVGARPTEVTYQKTFAVNDFYFGMPGYRKPMGNLQMLGKLQAGMLTAAMPFVPRTAMTALSRRSIDWYVMSEDLPDPENRVVLDGEHDPPDLSPQQFRAAPAPRARDRAHHAPARLAADPDEMARPADDLASMRHDPLRHGPRDIRARPVLQGLGPGKSLRRRRRLLSLVRCREPGAHHRSAGPAGGGPSIARHGIARPAEVRA